VCPNAACDRESCCKCTHAFHIVARALNRAGGWTREYMAGVCGQVIWVLFDGYDAEVSLRNSAQMQSEVLTQARTAVYICLARQNSNMTTTAMHDAAPAVSSACMYRSPAPQAAAAWRPRLANLHAGLPLLLLPGRRWQKVLQTQQQHWLGSHRRCHQGLPWAALLAAALRSCLPVLAGRLAAPQQHQNLRCPCMPNK
jgi:hypothetical protein